MTAAEIRQQVMANLERRLKILPNGVRQWKAAIQNQAELGIHSSQMAALEDMIDVLAEKQSALLGVVTETEDPSLFADAYLHLLEQLSGAQDVWRIFGTILGQRQDDGLRRLVDVADLVAWSCYATCMGEARRWQLVTESEFREPPLTYLESSVSPSTASRGEQVQSLGLSLRQYRDLMLPLPIVLYPLDQASSMWMLCSIAHEVGHNLDHDLDPRPDKRLTDEYRKLLIGRVPDDREPQWRRWMNEIFADAIAVLLCGAGFALSMAQWVVPLGPAPAFQQLDTRTVHPPWFLRLLLLVEMLASCAVAGLQSVGDDLRQLWQGLPRPAWQAAYEQDAAIVAKMLLEEVVAPLDGHRLLDLRPGLAFDHVRSAQLATHWLDASKPQPNPKAPAFPYRLVPAAAALAASKLVEPDAASLDMLQGKAVAYFEQIDRPVKLAGPPGQRRAFLKDLTRRLDFSRLREQL